MAKQTTSTPAKTNNNGAAIIPKATDPRAELFYRLGVIKGAGIDGADRITELVIDLTAPPAPTSTEVE